jgi:hypothetical protein
MSVIAVPAGINLWFRTGMMPTDSIVEKSVQSWPTDAALRCGLDCTLRKARNTILTELQKIRILGAIKLAQSEEEFLKCLAVGALFVRYQIQYGCTWITYRHVKGSDSATVEHLNLYPRIFLCSEFYAQIITTS